MKMSILSKFVRAAARAGWEDRHVEALARSQKKLRDQLQVLRGQSRIVPVPLRPNIRVDRTKPAVVPIGSLIHVNLHGVGPSRYDVSALGSYTVQEDDQIHGRVYPRLVEQGLISRSMGVHDLLAIKKRGLPFFRRYFGDTRLFAWKDVKQEKAGESIKIFFIDVRDDKVVEGWMRLNQAMALGKTVPLFPE